MRNTTVWYGAVLVQYSTAPSDFCYVIDGAGIVASFGGWGWEWEWDGLWCSLWALGGGGFIVIWLIFAVLGGFGDFGVWLGFCFCAVLLFNFLSASFESLEFFFHPMKCNDMIVMAPCRISGFW